MGCTSEQDHSRERPGRAANTGSRWPEPGSDRHRTSNPGAGARQKGKPGRPDLARRRRWKRNLVSGGQHAHNLWRPDRRRALHPLARGGARPRLDGEHRRWGTFSARWSGSSTESCWRLRPTHEPAGTSSVNWGESAATIYWWSAATLTQVLIARGELTDAAEPDRSDRVGTRAAGSRDLPVAGRATR